ncbi:hypothetical protein [Flavobacterium proteolyticum]|uniref:MORN repeat variant n=1 Tax=Flavobacterium proteolyticum TaxID=2911683 RepID=A0ABR9WR11_9FLAO|nr:hypothetical protein [Flavobacterium proteolyticum]MBE9575201.1 hypothetical protein [Flavobacterium proteolyticum]
MKSKFVLIMLLLQWITNAQEKIVKYEAKDFNLSKDVVSITTKIFVYDETKNKSEERGCTTMTFYKGMLQDEVINYFVASYSYKDNVLTNIKDSQSNYEVVYKNDKIDGLLKGWTRVANGKYDESGRLISIDRSKYRNGKAVKSQQVDIEYQSKDDFVEKITNYSVYDNPDKIISEIKNTYKKNMLTESTITTDGNTRVESYKLDKKGNQIQLIFNGMAYKNEFVFDKKGNTIFKMLHQSTSQNQVETYYYFTEIKYEDGTKQGSSDFNLETIRKFIK